MMTAFKHKTCVITGAGGGIGRELALALAERGARLALSDVNEVGLVETADAAERLGAEVHAAKLDVSNHAAIYDYADKIQDHFGFVHQLYNNAGISGMGELTDMTFSQIQRIIDINLLGVLHGSRAFLPRLISTRQGVLVNISSLNGFAAMPGLSVYCATKFGVRGLTEAIRSDALFHGHPIQVVCVHPGGIRTNIAQANIDQLADMPVETHNLRKRQLDLYENKLLTYPADRAADEILSGVVRGKNRIVITRQAKRLDQLTRLLPTKYLKMINQRMKRQLKA